MSNQISANDKYSNLSLEQQPPRSRMGLGPFQQDPTLNLNGVRSPLRPNLRSINHLPISASIPVSRLVSFIACRITSRVRVFNVMIRHPRSRDVILRTCLSSVGDVFMSIRHGFVVLGEAAYLCSVGGEGRRWASVTAFECQGLSFNGG